MAIFLVMHTGYFQFKLGLFNNSTLLLSRIGNKQTASKLLAADIKYILDTTAVSFSDIDFIAADCGPGPFTSLRTAVTTANGLGFALEKPLISLNSLEVLIEQERSSQWPCTVALYNAYNNDFYYAIEYQPSQLIIGCTSKNKIIEIIIQQLGIEKTIRFIGNDVHLIREQLINIFGNQAYFPEPMPLEPSIESFGKKAYESWLQQQAAARLEPIYLKTGYNLP